MTVVNLPATHCATDDLALTANPPIDSGVLVQRCMGNIAFAFELLDELVTSGRQQASAIVRHTHNDQPGEAAEIAHSLKGAAGIIGAEQLRVKAAEIEAAGHAGETSRLIEMALELRVEMERCLDFIPLLRTQLQTRIPG